jgi:hypothetical protein
MADLDIALFNTGFEQKQDEAALCQLGAAAVLLWDEVPSALQDKLLHLAEKVAGVPFTPVASAHIQGLIERNTNRT